MVSGCIRRRVGKPVGVCRERGREALQEALGFLLTLIDVDGNEAKSLPIEMLKTCCVIGQ